MCPVFILCREHAHTGARKGYELAIRVKHGDGEEDGDTRRTCFVVLDSLGQREAWAAAIRLRHDVGNKATVLRPAADGGAPPPVSALTSRYPTTKKQKWGMSKSLSRRAGEAAAGGGGPPSSGDADLDAAVDQFGAPGFREEEWLHDYLRTHSVDRLPEECDRLEKWMDAIKNGLRGAVLEQ